MALFTQAEEQRIIEAITAAEKSTSGEIIAVVASDSANYLHVPFLYAGLAALLVPWPFIYFTWLSVQTIYVIQLATFLLLVILLLPRRTRVALVTPRLKRMCAHRRAVEQFLAQGLHTTEARTGVLIFVSVAERYAEIIADEGIHKRVPPETWPTIIERLTRGIGEGRAADAFVEAIASAGAELSRHFPPGALRRNELPNRLIVLN